MDLNKISAITTDLAELAKKHGVIIMSGSPEALKNPQSYLEGFTIFVSEGEPSLTKRLQKVGENIKWGSSVTFKMYKNRHKDSI